MSPLSPVHRFATPEVSVIIPTFNRRALVSTAIESVLQQTYSDYELIVIDDGSTDGTREQLQPYMKSIRYLSQPNRGVSAARNTGINAASGEWVAFLDADDYWHPTKLQQQFEALSSLGSGIGACFTNCNYTGGPDGASTAFEESRLRATQTFGLLSDPHKYITSNKYGICVPSLLVLRSLLNDIGRFDEALGVAEDRDLIFRLAFKSKFCFVSEPLVNINRTPDLPRLTNLCSLRDDRTYTWGELLFKKMLAHPELVDCDMRQILRNELIDLYYNWATARACNLDLASTWKNIHNIRSMGPSYQNIFRRLLSRAGGRLSRILRNEAPKTGAE